MRTGIGRDLGIDSTASCSSSDAGGAPRPDRASPTTSSPAGPPVTNLNAQRVSLRRRRQTDGSPVLAVGRPVVERRLARHRRRSRPRRRHRSSTATATAGWSTPPSRHRSATSHVRLGPAATRVGEPRVVCARRGRLPARPARSVGGDGGAGATTERPSAPDPPPTIRCWSDPSAARRRRSGADAAGGRARRRRSGSSCS